MLNNHNTKEAFLGRAVFLPLAPVKGQFSNFKTYYIIRCPQTSLLRILSLDSARNAYVCAPSVYRRRLRLGYFMEPQLRNNITNSVGCL